MESTEALKGIATSSEAVDVASMVRDTLRAIASVTAEDIVRHARLVLADPETRELDEVLLAFGAIWLWGRNTGGGKGQSPAVEDWAEQPAWTNNSRLYALNPFLSRWFAGLSWSERVSVLSAYASVLSASPGELKALGVWSPPDAASAHAPLLLSFFFLLLMHAAIRRE